ncbi:DUF6392 family protein [Rosenbergiella nectarea]|uniref:DUF6392 family protein n=2 Tax=Rosenbergiella nectarea TaxID=988801 RepID=UPI001F4DDED2|nr:DUF6392 family protein [Rosenbergiella nectarea]
MTVNIETLIRNVGKTYENILEAGILPYRKKPTGAPGSPNLSLEMAREGIFLSFKRTGKILKSITLRLQHQPIINWVFPNEIPFPLQKNMSRRWVHDTFGEPDKSVLPKTVMKMSMGWVDRFAVEDFHIPITMQIRYDMQDKVEAVTYLPTSDLRW